MPPIIFLKGETIMDGKLTDRYPKEVTILGETWHIQFLNEENAPEFKERPSTIAYCMPMERIIVVQDEQGQHFPENFTDEAKIRGFNKSLRHEIVHAFLYESGLDCNTFMTGGKPWAKNEEMVDWFAIQGPKIVKAWKDMNCEEE